MSSPYIETFSGVRFTPLTPNPEDIRIGDVAHALSNQCRFSGHTRVHYSVAEHSVRVSELIEQWGHPREVQLWGLLHDASEAFLVDLPSPLKKDPRFAAYREAEVEGMRAVCRRFGLPLEEPACMRDADAVLLATEARDLMYHRPEHWAALTAKPLADVITPWTPSKAKSLFLHRYVTINPLLRGC